MPSTTSSKIMGGGKAPTTPTRRSARNQGAVASPAKSASGDIVPTSAAKEPTGAHGKEVVVAATGRTTVAAPRRTLVAAPRRTMEEQSPKNMQSGVDEVIALSRGRLGSSASPTLAKVPGAGKPAGFSERSSDHGSVNGEEGAVMKEEVLGAGQISNRPDSPSYSAVTQESTFRPLSPAGKGPTADATEKEEGANKRKSEGETYWIPKNPAKVPLVKSFQETQRETEDKQVRIDIMDALTKMAQGLSFHDKCVALGVAPHASGMCVETAAGAGGAIVPTGRRIAPGRQNEAFPSSVYQSDEMLARRLQAEEDALAEADEENIRKDAESFGSSTSMMNIV